MNLPPERQQLQIFKLFWLAERKLGPSACQLNRISAIFQKIALTEPKVRRLASGIRLFWV